MVSATVNHYRMRFYNNEKEILNLKTASISVPQVNNCIKIDEDFYTVIEVIPQFVTNKDINKYPHMEYIIKVEPSRRNSNEESY